MAESDPTARQLRHASRRWDLAAWLGVIATALSLLVLAH